MAKAKVQSTNPITALCAVVVLSVIYLLATGWLIMLSLDLINDDAPAVPALGYAASIGVSVLVSTLSFMWSNNDSSK